LDKVLDLKYFSFSNPSPNPNPTRLPKHQTITRNDQFSQRIWCVEYYSVHAHMVCSQKFRLTPDVDGYTKTLNHRKILRKSSEKRNETRTYWKPKEY